MSDSEEEETERQFKLVLLGDPQTGKTAIAQRWKLMLLLPLKLWLIYGRTDIQI